MASHHPHDPAHRQTDQHHHHHSGEHACCGAAAQPTPEPEVSSTATLYRIRGMDCASCAATITQSLSGVPGLSQPHVSIQREILSVELATPADAATVERTVKALGFGIAPLDDQPAVQKAWWNTPKTQHMLVSAGISALAFAGAQFVPSAEPVLLTLAGAFTLYPIARRALAAARLGTFFTIQMLLTIAACGAVVIGEQLEALLVILLFMLGEFLEGLAAEKARSGIKALSKLMPEDAWLIDGSDTRKVDAKSLATGQQILIRTGDRVPADGEIFSGQSSLDESTVTGESVPVSKGPGDAVFAGTINHSGALRVTVTASAARNTISRIIKLVEEAQDAKAPTERFIERFSRVYMPIILGLAVAVAIFPPLFGAGDWQTWTYRALALLLIGCPCALVISVPAAIAASLSTGSRQGILIKGGAVIEAIAQTQHVVFDKTGTLTLGQPRVSDVIAFAGSDDALLSVALGLEQGASHPLAQAICDMAQARGIPAAAFDQIDVLPGRGVEAGDCFIGAPRFAAERAPLEGAMRQRIATLEAEGKTVSLITQGGAVLGAIALRDEPRPSAHSGLAALRDLEVKAVMLTGDNARTAQAIGAELGIDSEAETLPEDKAARVAALAQTRHVLMVGDGVNDAPALAQAHVGVAMGSGTDVALEVADAALMRNDVEDVAQMITLARATMTNIRQNIVIALGLKAVFLVTSLTGVSGLWMAVLADTGATVLVTLNAMRLLQRARPKPRTDQPLDPGLGRIVPARP